MSKRERLTDKILTDKTLAYTDQNGKCWFCMLPMHFEHCELAHRVPQRKWVLAKWGPAVVHHRRNMALTHPGSCNAMAQMDPESRQAFLLMEDIRKEIENEKVVAH